MDPADVPAGEPGALMLDKSPLAGGALGSRSARPARFGAGGELRLGWGAPRLGRGAPLPVRLESACRAGRAEDGIVSAAGVGNPVSSSQGMIGDPAERGVADGLIAPP